MTRQIDPGLEDPENSGIILVKFYYSLLLFILFIFKLSAYSINYYEW